MGSASISVTDGLGRLRVAKIGEQAYVFEVLPVATVVESGSGFTSSVLRAAEPPAFGCSPMP